MNGSGVDVPQDWERLRDVFQRRGLITKPRTLQLDSASLAQLMSPSQRMGDDRQKSEHGK